MNQRVVVKSTRDEMKILLLKHKGCVSRVIMNSMSVSDIREMCITYVPLMARGEGNAYC
jgi:hypothetical protein